MEQRRTLQANQSGGPCLAVRKPQPGFLHGPATARPQSPSGNPAPHRQGAGGQRLWTSLCLLVLSSMLFAACASGPSRVRPVIEFTRLPDAAEGGPDKLDTIAGKVSGARPGQQIVLFARSEVWWVQPIANEPFRQTPPGRTGRISEPSTQHFLWSPITNRPQSLKAFPKPEAGCLP